MILTDAGTIISICDRGQGKNHLDCVRIIENIDDDFITTFPCLTEAMYFLGRAESGLEFDREFAACNSSIRH